MSLLAAAAGSRARAGHARRMSQRNRPLNTQRARLARLEQLVWEDERAKGKRPAQA